MEETATVYINSNKTLAREHGLILHSHTEHVEWMDFPKP